MTTDNRGLDDRTSDGIDEEARPSQDLSEDQLDGSAEGIETETGVQGAGGSPAASVDPEVEALRDRYLRLAAEYENFRKRTDRERLESRNRAQAQLVSTLLDPLDDLMRVADFTAENTSVDALLEGVRMVEQKLFRALESAGLESLDARGKPFDPEVHEAIMAAPTEVPEEDDTVGEVFQSGYLFRGALLRPARVQVRKHEG